MLTRKECLGLECRVTVQKSVNLIQLPFVVYGIVTLIAVYSDNVQAVQIWISVMCVMQVPINNTGHKYISWITILRIHDPVRIVGAVATHSRKEQRFFYFSALSVKTIAFAKHDIINLCINAIRVKLNLLMLTCVKEEMLWYYGH